MRILGSDFAHEDAQAEVRMALRNAHEYLAQWTILKGPSGKFIAEPVGDEGRRSMVEGAEAPGGELRRRALRSEGGGRSSRVSSHLAGGKK